VINCLFAYYAAIGAMTSGDVRFISLNSFTQFAIDFKIVDKKSKFLKQSDLDTLFIAIDSIAARVQCVTRILSHAERRAWHPGSSLLALPEALNSHPPELTPLAGFPIVPHLQSTASQGRRGGETHRQLLPESPRFP
jgi:hypothetical protein